MKIYAAVLASIVSLSVVAPAAPAFAQSTNQASSRAITADGRIASQRMDSHGRLTGFVLDTGRVVELQSGWAGRTPDYYAVGTRVHVSGYLSPDGSTIVRAQVTHVQ